MIRGWHLIKWDENKKKEKKRRCKARYIEYQNSLKVHLNSIKIGLKQVAKILDFPIKIAAK